MGNSKRGLVDIEIGGELHQVRFTLGAMRELEEHFKVKSLAAVFANAREWGTTDYLFVVAAGLKRGSMPDATPEKIEDLVTIAELAPVVDTLTKALRASATGSTVKPEASKDIRPTSGAPAPQMPSA